MSLSQPPLIGYATRGDSETETLMRRLRSLFVRKVSASGAAVICVCVFVGLFELLTVGVATALIGIVVCVFTTTVAAGGVRAVRRQRAMTLLRYCEQGIRLQMPLPNFLRAVAMNESPRMSERLLAIAETLEAPASLGGALKSELPALPGRTADVLRSAEANGTLPQTLSRIVRDETPPDPDRVADGPLVVAYLAIVGAAVMAASTLYFVFVLPKILQISRDFHITLPEWWYTVARVQIASGPYSFFGWPNSVFVAGVTVLIAAAILFALVSRNMRAIFFARASHQLPVTRLRDRVLWLVPIAGTQVRDRAYADACQTLADGIEQHRPFDSILREAASPHLNAVALARVEAWHLIFLSGVRLGEAARKARLPNLMSGLIGDASSTSDSLAPTFAFLARHYRARATGRGAWLSAALMPAAALVAGTVVGGLAVFIWTPLYLLIDATFPYPVKL